MDSVVTIDGLLKLAEDDIEAFEATYVVDFSAYAMLYDLDPGSDFYVDWANTMHKNGNSAAADWDFVYNNDFGQAPDNCIYNDATRLVYVHKSDFLKKTAHILVIMFGCGFYSQSNTSVPINPTWKFGSQQKRWLPPGYGKKTYQQMDPEEKAVIDEFEGAESYQKTIANAKYFLYDPSTVCLLEENPA